jgi:quercetin dioxygenase-like cupin family protein
MNSPLPYPAGRKFGQQLSFKVRRVAQRERAMKARTHSPLHRSKHGVVYAFSASGASEGNAMRWKLFCCAIFTSIVLISSLDAPSHTQTNTQPSAQSNPKLPTIGNCKPVTERTTEKGCWVLADQPVGRLETTQVFWHLDAYATRAAAEKAKGPRGAVVYALGKVWVLTIEAEAWRPNERGERVAEIGPLPVIAGEQYTALFMESISTPGATSPAHTHPGPEAWYTAAGETCMETPAGKLLGRPGAPGIVVPGGAPMQLTVTGTVQRRAITLILHDSSKPPSTEIHDWTPKGLCKQ